MGDYAVIIPSKKHSSFHNKNIYPLAGKPLLFYTVEAAVRNCVKKDIIITSDNPGLVQTAKEFGVSFDHRPSELAKPSTTLDQLLCYITEKYNYKYYVLLPPTSPLRDYKCVRDAVIQFSDEEADSLLSVTKEYRSIWSRPDHFGRPLVEVKHNRQDVDPVYVANGAIFITKRHIIESIKRKVGGRVSLFVMNHNQSVDIHNEYDIKLAEYLLNE